MEFGLSAIDNEELVHHAAREGHVISLEIYIKQNPHCLNNVYVYDQSKWTPLLAACFYQHEHVVRMLLNRFKPNTEVLGTIALTSITSHLDLAEEASPLWAAAAVNHFDIVKLLIEHGNANVNHLIKTHSTALRAACYHNNLGMVRYLIEHGANPFQTRKGNYTNLMLSADRQFPLIVEYLVNEVKCDVNEQDENGQTALYYAVRSGSIEITKFLLQHGALNIRDERRKVTPLMRAALFGKVNLVNCFQGYCSDIEWIEAKEILATSFSGCISDIENINKTVEYLTEAYQLRSIKNLPKQTNVQPLELLKNRRECQTLEQFNQLISSNPNEALQIESILIHQRLLNDDQNDFHDAIHYYGASLAYTNQYHNCFLWWSYEFDLKQKYDISYETDRLRKFISVFVRQKFDDNIDIPVEDLLRMFVIMNTVLKSNSCKEDFNSNIIILLHLITIVGRIMYSENYEEKQKLSIEDFEKLNESIRHVIWRHYKTTDTNSTLLHLCTSSSTEEISFQIYYPCLMTTRLLVENGVDVNSFDSDGNTPLHKLVRNTPSSNIIKIIDLLCDSGAHLDYVNKNGQMPIELLDSFRGQLIKRLKIKMNVSRLKCICARLIQQRKLSYENLLSSSLLKFVEKH